MENIMKDFKKFIFYGLLILSLIILEDFKIVNAKLQNKNCAGNTENVSNQTTNQFTTFDSYYNKKIQNSNKKEKNNGNNTVTLKSSRGFLNIFNVLVFNNEDCVSNDTIKMNGTCYKMSECENLGGTVMGTCANGIGVCCVFKYNCGTTSTETLSYFQNVEYPLPSSGPITCTLTINISDDIQQILLEFLIFEFQRPSDGDCIDDEFIISGQNRNFIIPPLCGINTGQHILIDVDQSPTKILHMSAFGKANNMRSFNIKISQKKERISPRGCLQYFTGPWGIIKSFNYDDVGKIINEKGGSYFNNLNYAICIEREKNMCSITYTNVIDEEELEFNIVNTDTYKRYINTFECPDDFLAVNGFRLCGETLSQIIQKSKYDEQSTTGSIIDNGNGPIVLPFRSDNMYVGRGFQIIYEQNYFCRNPQWKLSEHLTQLLKILSTPKTLYIKNYRNMVYMVKNRKHV